MRLNRCPLILALTRSPVFHPLDRSGLAKDSQDLQLRCRISWRTTLRTFGWGKSWDLWCFCRVRRSSSSVLWSSQLRAYNLACWSSFLWWVRTIPRQWCSWQVLLASCFLLFGGSCWWFHQECPSSSVLPLFWSWCFPSSVLTPRCSWGCWCWATVLLWSWTTDKPDSCRHSQSFSRFCFPSLHWEGSQLAIQTHL